MISFYPGPSQVYKEIPAYVQEAYETGIISENHRSKRFMKLYKSTVKLLKKRLEIPDDYHVLFASSATECWEIIAQSLIARQSYHFFNGSFGEKWYKNTHKLHPLAIGYRFGEDVALDPGNIDLSGSEYGLICITQNETSNGTQVLNEQIAAFKNTFPEYMIAVDATSSMGGVALDFSLADVWYASVQKCFGLPAGMSVLVISPRALEQAMGIGDNRHYNSLMIMQENAAKFQTHVTPNILDIYLLNQTMKKARPIHKVNKRLDKRLLALTRIIRGKPDWEFLCQNETVRSTTVIALKGQPRKVEELKKKAREHGLILGNGYGPYAKETVRIANFPATTRSDWKLLRDFLTEHL